MLWKEAFDTLATGIGFPALFQDKICIQAMEKTGINRRDAENYAIVGCVELTVPGKEYANTEALRINWAKVLEEYCCQIASGLLDEPADFTGFLNGYLELLGKRLESATRANDLLNTNYSAHWPAPFLSCLMDGCMQSGKDVTDNGPQYSFQSINSCGMANTVDSLMAIREIIYQKKRFSLKEYLGIIKHNFEGYESLRKSVWESCIRFGSDWQAAELMRKISDSFLGQCRELAGGEIKPIRLVIILWIHMEFWENGLARCQMAGRPGKRLQMAFRRCRERKNMALHRFYLLLPVR